LRHPHYGTIATGVLVPLSVAEDPPPDVPKIGALDFDAAVADHHRPCWPQSGHLIVAVGRRPQGPQVHR